MAGADSYACGSLLYGIWDFPRRAGSSDKLVKYMKDEKMNVAYNTQNGIVNIPEERVYGTNYSSERKVKLGEMGCHKRRWNYIE